MEERPHLSIEETQRAIYLGMEGRVGRPPTLLGVLWVSRRGQEPMFRQYVLDGAFASAAAATGRRSRSLAVELKTLMSRAQSQDRVIVGWGEHQLRTVGEFAPEFAEPLDLRYRDARALARRWRKKLHPDFDVATNHEGKKHSLARYEVLTAYPLRPELSAGRVAKTITEVRGALECGNSYGGLSAKLQARWSDLLSNNEHGCRATRAVCLEALDELHDPDLNNVRTKKNARADKKNEKKVSGRVA